MSVRERTLLTAVRVMEEALLVYRDGSWNDDYPGGIDLWPNEDSIERGGRAAKALRNPSVKRAIAAVRAAESLS